MEKTVQPPQNVPVCPTQPQPVPQVPPTPTKEQNFDYILLRKFSPLLLRRILPMALCFMAFAIVMTVLVLYMNVTAMRHHQFRVNMSRDYELLEVSQDNPQLAMYIREFQLKPAIEPDHKHLEYENKGPSEDTAYVLKLLNDKREGIFIESGAYNDGKTSKTEYLEKELGWKGLLIQPDLRHFCSLLQHNRAASQAIHACLSPTPYPKEVTYHPGNADVKINSIHSNSLIDEPTWFNTRVKCFPLYSLLLAMNVTNVDYFSLESGGTELQVLETIPFDKVRIEVINVHLLSSTVEKDTIKKFLATKKYKFMSQNFNNTFVFMYNRLKI